MIYVNQELLKEAEISGKGNFYNNCIYLLESITWTFIPQATRLPTSHTSRPTAWKAKTP